eukprot:TRINITY_DN1481_c0_g1_i1.p1 TRINITY_DN1481_c0_g1~~TRINITY_DN1481_c0_g1_i1.p1  ORF type:complete len:3786 (+),score=600.23 TRINITY_DN1481_c0_g1_i1:52-11409(+)
MDLDKLGLSRTKECLAENEADESDFVFLWQEKDSWEELLKACGRFERKRLEEFARGFDYWVNQQKIENPSLLVFHGFTDIEELRPMVSCLSVFKLLDGEQTRIERTLTKSGPLGFQLKLEDCNLSNLADNSLQVACSSLGLPFEFIRDSFQCQVSQDLCQLNDQEVSEVLSKLKPLAKSKVQVTFNILKSWASIGFQQDAYLLRREGYISIDDLNIKKILNLGCTLKALCAAAKQEEILEKDVLDQREIVSDKIDADSTSSSVTASIPSATVLSGALSEDGSNLLSLPATQDSIFQDALSGHPTTARENVREAWAEKASSPHDLKGSSPKQPAASIPHPENDVQIVDLNENPAQSVVDQQKPQSHAKAELESRRTIDEFVLVDTIQNSEAMQEGHLENQLLPRTHDTDTASIEKQDQPFRNVGNVEAMSPLTQPNGGGSQRINPILNRDKGQSSNADTNIPSIPTSSPAPTDTGRSKFSLANLLDKNRFPPLSTPVQNIPIQLNQPSNGEKIIRPPGRKSLSGMRSLNVDYTLDHVFTDSSSNWVPMLASVSLSLPPAHVQQKMVASPSSLIPHSKEIAALHKKLSDKYKGYFNFHEENDECILTLYVEGGLPNDHHIRVFSHLSSFHEYCITKESGGYDDNNFIATQRIPCFKEGWKSKVHNLWIIIEKSSENRIVSHRSLELTRRGRHYITETTLSCQEIPQLLGSSPPNPSEVQRIPYIVRLVTHWLESMAKVEKGSNSDELFRAIIHGDTGISYKKEHFFLLLDHILGLPDVAVYLVPLAFNYPELFDIKDAILGWKNIENKPAFIRQYGDFLKAALDTQEQIGQNGIDEAERLCLCSKYLSENSLEDPILISILTNMLVPDGKIVEGLHARGLTTGQRNKLKQKAEHPLQVAKDSISALQKYSRDPRILRALRSPIDILRLCVDSYDLIGCFYILNGLLELFDGIESTIDSGKSSTSFDRCFAHFIDILYEKINQRLAEPDWIIPAVEQSNPNAPFELKKGFYNEFFRRVCDCANKTEESNEGLVDIALELLRRYPILLDDGNTRPILTSRQIIKNSKNPSLGNQDSSASQKPGSRLALLLSIMSKSKGVSEALEFLRRNENLIANSINLFFSGNVDQSIMITYRKVAILSEVSISIVGVENRPEDFRDCFDNLLEITCEEDSLALLMSNPPLRSDQSLWEIDVDIRASLERYFDTKMSEDLHFAYNCLKKLEVPHASSQGHALDQRIGFLISVCKKLFSILPHPKSVSDLANKYDAIYSVAFNKAKLISSWSIDSAEHLISSIDGFFDEFKRSVTDQTYTVSEIIDFNKQPGFLTGADKDYPNLFSFMANTIEHTRSKLGSWCELATSWTSQFEFLQVEMRRLLELILPHRDSFDSMKYLLCAQLATLNDAKWHALFIADTTQSALEQQLWSSHAHICFSNFGDFVPLQSEPDIVPFCNQITRIIDAYIHGAYLLYRDIQSRDIDIVLLHQLVNRANFGVEIRILANKLRINKDPKLHDISSGDLSTLTDDFVSLMNHYDAHAAFINQCRNKELPILLSESAEGWFENLSRWAILIRTVPPITLQEGHILNVRCALRTIDIHSLHNESYNEFRSWKHPSDKTGEFLQQLAPILEIFLKVYQESKGSVDGILEYCQSRAGDQADDNALISNARDCWIFIQPLVQYKENSDSPIDAFLHVVGELHKLQFERTELVAHLIANTKRLELLLDDVFSVESKQAIKKMNDIIEAQDISLVIGPQNHYTLVHRSLSSTNTPSVLEANLVPTSNPNLVLKEMRRLYQRLSLVVSFGNARDPEIKRIKHFTILLQVSFELFDLFKEMQLDGHPGFQIFTERIPGNISIEDVDARLKSFRDQKELRKKHVQKYRESHSILNHFTNRQLLRLMKLGFPKPSQNCDEFYNLVKLITRDLTTEQISQGVLAALTQNGDPEMSYDSLGKVLNDFCNQYPQHHIQNLQGQGSAGVKSFVVQKDVDLWIATLCYYMHECERFPMFDEILECTLETTYEQLEIFLLKIENPPPIATPNDATSLYCILEPAGLESSLQRELIVRLGSLANLKYPLVLLSAQEENIMVSSLRKWAPAEPFLEVSAAMLQQIRDKLGKDQISVNVVTSKTPSEGKSYWIRKQYQLRNITDYQKISIRNSTSRDTFHNRVVTELGKNKSILWVDLGITCYKIVNSFLFRLIILKASTSSDGAILHMPSPLVVFIEMPSMRPNKRHACAPFLEAFGAVGWSSEIDVTNENLDLIVSYKVEDEIQQLRGGPKKQERLVAQNMIQYVCKTLLKVQANKEDFCNRPYHPHADPDLTTDRCKEILGRFCAPRHFQINLVKFCFTQFRILEDSTFFRQDNARQQFFNMFSPKKDIAQVIVDCAKIFSSSTFDNEAMQVTKQWKDVRHPPLFFTGSGDVLPLYEENDEEIKNLKLAEPLIWENQNTSVTGNNRLEVYRRILEFVRRAQMYQPKMSELRNTTPKSASIAKEIIKRLFNVSEQQYASTMEKERNFVITKDNLLKLITIYFRMKSYLPLIIMGETGCGKTRLIEFMANIIGAKLFKLDVHGGIKDHDIVSIIGAAKDFATKQPETTVIVFFDEINTSSSVDLFKDCICERICEGDQFSNNMFVIGACNPYRSREVEGDTSTPGLVFRYANPDSNLFAEDSSELLAYMVYLIPPSMGMHVWDFGSLSDDDEVDYIRFMIVTQLEGQTACSKTDLFGEMIVRSQRFMRKIQRDNSCVSLRDVKRCIHLEYWFRARQSNRIERIKQSEQRRDATWIGTLLQNIPAEKLDDNDISIVLALCCCYYYRLSDKAIPGGSHRSQYLEDVLHNEKPLSGILIQTRAFIRGKKILFTSADSFKAIVDNEKHLVVESLDVKETTSKNEALTENVFIMIVSIFNCLPALIVGKPGTSKSFSISLIKQTFKSTQRKKYFENLPILSFSSMQCSPLTKPEDIQRAYEQCEQEEKKKNEKSGHVKEVLCVLLLDEVGLAEQSPFLPLKVLHQLLEPPRIPVIGISNWKLDASKTNRMLLLNRQDPTKQELIKTAHDMLLKPMHHGLANRGDGNESVMIAGVTHAYFEIYTKHQPAALSYRGIENSRPDTTKSDFYGLRDFYALVNCLKVSENLLNAEKLSKAISRSLSGDKKSNLERKMELFPPRIGQRLPKPAPTTDLIRESIGDPSSRHLMVITEHAFALQYLLDKNVLNDRTKILYCADYADSRDERSTAELLTSIRYCMQEGNILVMVGQNHVYELLYDLLNQHYVDLGSKRVCHIPIGLFSNDMYVIHDEFKCIIIATSEEAYCNPPRGLPAPFLNRFEKQYLTIEEELNDECNRAFHMVMKGLEPIIPQGLTRALGLSQAFARYHEGFVQSILLTLNSLNPQERAEDLAKQAISKLMFMAYPEWILTIPPGMEILGVPIRETYQRRIAHRSLHDAVKAFLPGGPCDDGCEGDLNLNIWTHCEYDASRSLPGHLSDMLNMYVEVIDLHQIPTERELKEQLTGWLSMKDHSCLLVYFIDRYCTVDRLNHFKFCYRKCKLEEKGDFQKHLIIIHYCSRSNITGTQSQEEAYRNLQRQTTDQVRPITDKSSRHIYIDELVALTEVILPTGYQAIRSDFPLFFGVDEPQFSNLVLDVISKISKEIRQDGMVGSLIDASFDDSLDYLQRGDLKTNKELVTKLCLRIRRGISARGFQSTTNHTQTIEQREIISFKAFWDTRLHVESVSRTSVGESETHPYFAKYHTLARAYQQRLFDIVSDEVWLLLVALCCPEDSVGGLLASYAHLSNFTTFDGELRQRFLELR